MFHLAQNCNKANPGSLCWFGHSVYSWGDSWGEVPLLCSCCSLLFQKCFGGALNVWSLPPVQIHPFIKQQSNWLSSVVVTRKNFCGFQSTVFVADSCQEMRLFQSYIFGFQDTLSTLSKWMINVSSGYWDCWWTQQPIFQCTCTVPGGQLFWDRCSVWTLQVSFTSRWWVKIWWQCPRGNLASPVQHLGKMRWGIHFNSHRIIFLYLRLKKPEQAEIQPTE